LTSHNNPALLKQFKPVEGLFQFLYASLEFANKLSIGSGSLVFSIVGTDRGTAP
jgi:hypothetical protein